MCFTSQMISEKQDSRISEYLNYRWTSFSNLDIPSTKPVLTLLNRVGCRSRDNTAQSDKLMELSLNFVICR